MRPNSERTARSMQMTCLRICDGRRVRRRRRVKPWEHCFEIYRNHAWSVASVVDALNRAKQRVLKDLLSAECARREECRTATETALSMGNLSSSRLSLRLLRSSSDFPLVNQKPGCGIATWNLCDMRTSPTSKLPQGKEGCAAARSTSNSPPITDSGPSHLHRSRCSKVQIYDAISSL